MLPDNLSDYMTRQLEAAEGFEINPPNEHALVFATPEGDPIVTIHFDGRLEVNPKFTVDDAARAFWTVLQSLVNKHLARGAHPCPRCEGKGTILREVLYADETPDYECPDCHGTGRAPERVIHKPPTKRQSGIPGAE